MLIVPGVISYAKLKPTAEDPKKDFTKNVTYDVAIIERSENRTEDVINGVNVFGTGLVLNAPKHYHLEVIAHPSLYKTGYMFASTPIVIDPDNTEELVLPLFKFAETEDIELPFIAASLILRETEYCTLSCVSNKKEREYVEEYPVPRRGAANTANSGRGGSRSGGGAVRGTGTASRGRGKSTRGNMF